MRQCISLSFALPAVGLILVLSEVLNGQTAKPQTSAEPAFKTHAREVLLDVVVTDRDRHPVQALPKDNFRVEEDGHLQKINYFEEHAATAHLTPIRPAHLPPNFFMNIPLEKLPDSVTALLFDALNTPLQDQTFVRAEMLKYLKNPRFDRRMAIFALGTQLRFVQGFSDDPALLAVALNNVKTGAGLETSPLRQTYEEKAEDQKAAEQLRVLPCNPHIVPVSAYCALRQFQAEQTSSRIGARVALTLEAFEELARYLGGIPGRKNVVWFSTSFPLGVFANHKDLFDPDAVQRDYGERVRRTAALLAEAHVAVYPLSAAGTSPDAFYDPERRPDPVANPGPGVDNDNGVQRNAEYATMDEIAADTGGQAFYDTNGLSDALNRIADLGSYFYTISYTPTNGS